MDDPDIIVTAVKVVLLLTASIVLFFTAMLFIRTVNTLENCVDLGYMMISGQKYQCTLVE